MAEGPYKWERGQLTGPSGAIAMKVGTEDARKAMGLQPTWSDDDMALVANNAHAAALRSLDAAPRLDLTQFETPCECDKTNRGWTPYTCGRCTWFAENKDEVLAEIRRLRAEAKQLREAADLYREAARAYEAALIGLQTATLNGMNKSTLAAARDQDRKADALIAKADAMMGRGWEK